MEAWPVEEGVIAIFIFRFKVICCSNLGRGLLPKKTSQVKYLIPSYKNDELIKLIF